MNNKSLNENVTGFWGKPTSTLDWCEQNYEVTTYIAEFWNTISNVLMISFPLYGIYWSLKQRSRYAKLFSKSKDLNEAIDVASKNKNIFIVPSSFIYSLVGMMMIGIGSWLFHMTLQYSAQLLDELPMIWATGISAHAYYDLLKNTFKKPPSAKTNTLVAVGILFYCVAVTVIYTCYFTNPVFHQVAFGILCTFIVFQSFVLAVRLNLSFWLFFLSMFYYLSGLFLWTIDNKFCSFLQTYRDSLSNFADLSTNNNFKAIILNSILIFLKSFSQLHAVWHIFTGYGSYLVLLYLIEAHYEYNVQNSKERKKRHPEIRPLKRNCYSLIYHLDNSFLKLSEKEV